MKESPGLNKHLVFLKAGHLQLTSEAGPAGDEAVAATEKGPQE